MTIHHLIISSKPEDSRFGAIIVKDQHLVSWLTKYNEPYLILACGPKTKMDRLKKALFKTLISNGILPIKSGEHKVHSSSQVGP